MGPSLKTGGCRVSWFEKCGVSLVLV